MPKDIASRGWTLDEVTDVLSTQNKWRAGYEERERVRNGFG